MTRTEAKEILDMRRAGADMPIDIVNNALRASGDLEEAFPLPDDDRAILEAS